MNANQLFDDLIGDARRMWKIFPNDVREPHRQGLTRHLETFRIVELVVVGDVPQVFTVFTGFIGHEVAQEQVYALLLFLIRKCV